MNWDDDYDDQSPDGTCQSCGTDLESDASGPHDEHHRLCWQCWRADQGIEEPAWRRSRPQPDTPPESFVEGLVRLRAEIKALRERVEALERGRAA